MNATKLNLMIVDDHVGMRNMIRQLIAAPGDTVLECASGDEAVRAIAGFRPDCVTMDVRLPGLCAFKTVRAIREAHPAARIIVVTSYDQPDFRQAARDAGAANYVVKENLSELYLLVAPQRLSLNPSRQPGSESI